MFDPLPSSDLLARRTQAVTLARQRPSHPETIPALRIGLALFPDDAFLWAALAQILAPHQPVRAMHTLRTALRLVPNQASYWLNLGSMVREHGQPAYRRALALNPQMAMAWKNLGVSLLNHGQVVEGCHSIGLAIRLQPNWERAYSNWLFAHAYDHRWTPSQRFEAYRDYGHRFFSGTGTGTGTGTGRPLERPLDRRLGGQAADHPSVKGRILPDPDRRLRIVYLSDDLFAHPVAHNITNLLLHHDANHFEVHVFYTGSVQDDTTHILQSAIDHWHDAAHLDDRAIATRIHALRTDILVLLAGHVGANRLPVSFYRPAPLQISAHDVGTSGVAAIDYRLTDRELDPPDTAEGYTEKLVYLPCFYSYPPLEHAPDPGPPPCLASGRITFGSFNNPAKLSARTLDLWAAVLAALPDSRLLLRFAHMFGSADVQSRFRERFARRGIKPHRLVFSDHVQSRPAHLRLLNQVDIALDPTPFNGATTSFEALYMGVPVIALRGDRFVGRVAASFLGHVGLPECIADSQEGFVRAATGLATDRSRLVALRKTLRRRLQASPLMQAAEHARSVEAAYRSLWRDWCAEQLQGRS